MTVVANVIEKHSIKIPTMTNETNIIKFILLELMELELVSEDDATDKLLPFDCLIEIFSFFVTESLETFLVSSAPRPPSPLFFSFPPLLAVFSTDLFIFLEWLFLFVVLSPIFFVVDAFFVSSSLFEVIIVNDFETVVYPDLNERI
uniref:Uncharacterized protein n=1 Tax=Romanomermis culicivorax TaxID=13658 RepID=A0A915LED5_ROMCU